MAQALQAELPLQAGLRVGFDGHESNHEALLRGDLDLYADYVGTALHRYLQLAPLPRRQVHPTVQREARQRWQVEWLDPIGFDNTYGLLMVRATAERMGIARISELATHAERLTMGATKRFLTNDPPLTFAPGGYPALQQSYGLRFGKTVATGSGYSEPFLAIARGEADVVADFVVNPYIEALDLVELADDREFFSAYYIAPIVRGNFLERYPAARAILQGLAWSIDNRTMARLNYEMEFNGRNPDDLATGFLATHQKHTANRCD